MLVQQHPQVVLAGPDHGLDNRSYANNSAAAPMWNRMLPSINSEGQPGQLRGQSSLPPHLQVHCQLPPVNAPFGPQGPHFDIAIRTERRSSLANSWSDASSSATPSPAVASEFASPRYSHSTPRLSVTDVVSEMSLDNHKAMLLPQHRPLRQRGTEPADRMMIDSAPRVSSRRTANGAGSGVNRLPSQPRPETAQQQRGRLQHIKTQRTARARQDMVGKRVQDAASRLCNDLEHLLGRQSQWMSRLRHVGTQNTGRGVKRTFTDESTMQLFGSTIHKINAVVRARAEGTLTKSAAFDALLECLMEAPVDVDEIPEQPASQPAPPVREPTSDFRSATMVRSRLA